MTAVPTAPHRKYSARAFVRGGMSCPHCQAEFEEPVESCPRCRFDLGYCEKTFPFKAPPLALRLDPSKLLPESVARDIRRPYRKFCKRFPQIDFTFCFVKLQADLDLRDFAFWLHNSAPDADPHRAWRILVVSDLATGRITLSPGFALEPFLHTDPLRSSLQELAACLSEQAWAEGISGFIRDCDHFLSQAWEAAHNRRHRIETPNHGKEAAP